MTAHNNYISSIITAFSTFLENLELSESEKISAEELLVEYLQWKTKFDIWSTEDVEAFFRQTQIEINKLDSSKENARQVLIQFVKKYPPYQIEVFLHKFLLALKEDGCSKSTVKNYRSDINQFVKFANQKNIKNLLTKTKLNDFYRFQKEKGLKNSTITRKFSSIVQFGLWLKQETLLPTPPAWLKPGYVFAFDQNLKESNELESKIKTNDQTESQKKDKTKSSELASSDTKDQPTKPTKQPNTNLLSLDFSKANQTNLRKNQEQRARLKSDLHGLSNKLYKQVQTSVKAFAPSGILPFINTAVLILFFLGLGTLGYKQFFSNAPVNLAYPTAPTAPGRTLSFQGRLTDQAQNPITSATDMKYKLWSAESGGVEVDCDGGGDEACLWESTDSSCSVDPDQDGIFSVGLGDTSDCPPTIPDSVFTENANVWLEVTVDSETLSPRQAIRTVAYATNAESLQGFPLAPTGGATTNTVVTMNNDGTILLGEENPKLESSSGTFTIEGQALTIQTASGTNGNITLAPDGTGDINLQAADVLINEYIKHAGDTDTYFQFSDTGDIISVAAGGVELINITEDDTQDTITIGSTSNDTDIALNDDVFVQGSDGNVGIGDTTPGAKFVVAGESNFYVNSSGSVYGKAFYDVENTNYYIDPSSGGDSLIVSGAGHIGATNAPIAMLEISNDDDSQPVLRLEPVSSPTVDYFQIGSTSGGTTGDIFVVDENGNVGIGTTNPDRLFHAEIADSATDSVVYGQRLSHITSGTAAAGLGTGIEFEIEGADGSNNVLSTIQAIQVGAGTGAEEGELAFLTADLGDDDLAERMRINKDGNVGIGTSTPDVMLDIKKDSAFFIDFDRTDNANVDSVFNMGVSYSALGDDFMFFGLDGQNNDLVVDDDGNVGINTTTPGSYNFNVNGTALIVGNAEFDAGIIDSNGELGSDGQVLSSTGTTLDWIDVEGVGGTTQDLSEVLAEGYITNGYNMVMTTTDEIRFYDDDADARIYGPSDGQIQIDSTVWGITGAGAGSGFTQLTVDNVDINGNTVAATNGDGLYLYEDGSNGIFIEDGGYVGLGTTNPTNILTLSGAGKDLHHYSYSNSEGSKADYDIYWARGTESSPAIVQDQDRLGSLRFYGWDGTDEFKAAAQIRARVDGTPNNNDVPGKLEFLTAQDVVGSLGIRMVIDDSGNVGIGTTSPDQLLHAEIADSATDSVVYGQRLSHITSGTAAAGLGTGIEFEIEGADGSNNVLSTIQAIQTDASTGAEEGELAFLTADLGDDDLAERMRINKDGNVGIGDTTPSYKLEITGDGYISTSFETGTTMTVGSTLNIGSIGSTSDNNRVLTSSGAGSGDVEYIDTSSWDKTESDDVTGSGTASYIPKWDTGGASLTDSAIYDDSGNIGIGTTEPSYFFDVTESFSPDTWNVNTYIHSDVSGADDNYSALVTMEVEASTATTGSGGSFWTEAYASFMDAFATNDAYVQRVFSTYNQMETHADDIGYGTYIKSRSTSTGGTQYGVYIDLDDADISAYGLYQETANTNYLAGNLGIGKTDPGSKLQVAGNITPSDDDTYDLGTDSLRWKDIYLGPDSLHIGTSTTDEGTISYDTTNDILDFSTDSTTDADIAFFSDDLYLDKSAGNVGVGTTEPDQLLHAEVSDSATDSVVYGQRLSHITSGTAAAGLGTGIEFEIEGADGSNNVLSTIQAIQTSAGTGAEEGELAFLTADLGDDDLTERMRINKDGNVGIGDTDPGSMFVVNSENDFYVNNTGNAYGKTFYDVENTNYYLNPSSGGDSLIVSGAGHFGNSTAPIAMLEITNDDDAQPILRLEPLSSPSTDYFQIGSASDGTTGDIMVVNSDGNVGIGTTTPSHLLTVTGNNKDVRFYSYSSTGTGYKADLEIARARNTEASPAIITDNDYLGSVRLMGYDGDEFHTGAQILAQVEGTPGNNDLPTELQFLTTADGGSSPSVQMVIEPTGEVGIGTSSPGHLLDVDGDINLTAGENIRFGGYNAIRGDATNLNIIPVNSSGLIQFLNYAEDTTNVAIQNDGNVGIGTTEPQNNLHIHSAAGSNSAIYLSDGDVNHGVTDWLPTNAGGAVQQTSSEGGGLGLVGISEGTNRALALYGILGSDDPTDSIEAIQIRGMKQSGTGTQALGDNETLLNISNNDSSTLMTILGSGNVGIGTTTPGYGLELHADMEIENDDDDGFIRFHDPGNTHYSIGLDYSDSSKFKINYGATVGAANHLIMDVNGNVGIGVTNPDTMFQVADTIKMNGIRIDQSFDYDDVILFAPQAYFEAESSSVPDGWGWNLDGFTEVNDTTVPFSKVSQSTTYDQIYSDYIPVNPGDRLYGEIWAERDNATGTAGLLYYGIEQYDKDKKPTASNSGCNYFVASGQTVPTTATWTKYSNHITLATSHTPYDGSDGGPVRYVRVRILINYNAGTIATKIGGIMLRRVEQQRDDGEIVFNGNVGINDTTPSYQLDVDGNIYANGGWFRVSGNNGLYFESYGTGIQSPIADGGNYGSVSTYGNEGGWEGYSLNGDHVLMNSGTEQVGLYDDTDNHWLAYWSAADLDFYHNNGEYVLHADEDSYTYLYYNNSWKLRTNSDGATVNGSIRANQGTGKAALMVHGHITAPDTTDPYQIFNKYGGAGGSFLFRKVSATETTSGYTDLFTISNDGHIKIPSNRGLFFGSIDNNYPHITGNGPSDVMYIGEADYATDGLVIYMQGFTNHQDGHSDLAEWFSVDETMQKADLVSSSENKIRVKRSSQPYSQDIMGFISTDPSIGIDTTNDPDAQPVALAGRVPAKVASINNELISHGDAITSSYFAGIGMKATQAGPIVGKALESTSHWSEASCPVVSNIDAINWPFDEGNNSARPCYRVPISSLDSETRQTVMNQYNISSSDYFYVGKIMTFVNVSWYDPDVYLSDTGDFSLNTTALADGSLDVEIENTETGEMIDRVGVFAKILAGKIKSGFIEAEKIATSTLEATQASIDELTTNKIKLGNFELAELNGLLNIKNESGETVATIDENGNTNLAGNITAPDSELNSSTPSQEASPIEETNPTTNTTQASGSSRLAKLMSDEIETRDLVATGSTRLAELLVDEASVSGTLIAQNLEIEQDVDIAGETRLGSLIADQSQVEELAADNITSDSISSNQADITNFTAENADISGTLAASQSRLEYLESQLAYLDEINANTAQIVQGQFETATVSGTLYADSIDGFEDKVAEAFRQPSLLGTLLGQDESSDISDVIAEVESAGFTASGSAQIKQTLADLELAENDVVISPKAAYIKDYLQVNGSGYIGDSLGIGNYLVMGDGMKIKAENGIASIDYLSESNPAGTTLAFQSSGVGRINLLAGTMVIDDTGSVLINGDLHIAGNLDVDGEIRAKDTLLTNLIQPDNFDQPTQIKLATRSAQTDGQVAGASTDSSEVKESRLEIVNESGTPVATISATGRADFSNGLGVDQEDLTATDSAEIETQKTSGKAKIAQGQTELIIKSEKITKDSQIFVTPLGSTDDQVLYVKSQTAENSLTSEKEGQFIVGFDQETSKDVKFNWWIIN